MISFHLKSFQFTCNLLSFWHSLYFTNHNFRIEFIHTSNAIQKTNLFPTFVFLFFPFFCIFFLRSWPSRTNNKIRSAHLICNRRRGKSGRINTRLCIWNWAERKRCRFTMAFKWYIDLPMDTWRSTAAAHVCEYYALCFMHSIQSEWFLLEHATKYSFGSLYKLQC